MDKMAALRDLRVTFRFLREPFMHAWTKLTEIP